MTRWSALPGAAVAGWLLATLPLLLAGAWRPVPVVVLGLCGAGAAGWVVVRHGASPSHGAPWPRWAVGLVLAVAAGTAVLGAVTHGEQVVVVRDGGTYANSARWLAGHGSMEIPGRLAAFGGPSPELNLDSPGFFEVGDDVVPQFLPGLPMLLAPGWWLGGWTGLLIVPGLLMGFAVLAFGGLVGRVVGPSMAPLGAAVLAAAFPVLDVARQTLSEGASMLLLLSGLSLLVLAADASSRRLAMVAGLVLGSACLVRVDALREVLLLVAVLGWWALRRRHVAGAAGAGVAVGRRHVAAVAGAGVAVATVASVVSAVVVARPYLEEIRGSMLPLLTALVLGSLLTPSVVAVARRRGLTPRGLGPRWAAAAGVLTVGVLVALALRPLWLTARQPGSKATADIARLQRFEGIRVDGARTYSEHSLSWVSWWLGWPLVGFAVLTAGWVVWQAASGRRPGLGAVVTVLLGSAVMTLARPAITPDHPWADRRLVPTVLPAFALLAVVGLSELLRLARARDLGRRGRVLLAGAGVTLLLGPALVASASLALERTEVGQRAALQRVCRALPEDAAVLFVDVEPRSQWLQALRGECGVPAASLLRPSGERADDVVARMRAAGFTPVLASADDGAGILALDDGAVQVVDLVTRQHGRTLTHRPTRTWQLRNRLWIAVPPR